MTEQNDTEGHVRRDDEAQNLEHDDTEGHGHLRPPADEAENLEHDDTEGHSFRRS